MENMVDFSKPTEIDKITQAFPASIGHLMPAYKEIPEDFRNFNDRTEWNKIVSYWFFNGLNREVEFYPKDGIDPKIALRHIQTIIGSFQPKHEHKIAACAYLLSLWFDRIEKWKKTEPESKS